MRKLDVAHLVGCSEQDVQEVSVKQVQQALEGRVSREVLQTATQETATYWRVEERYFLDDPLFGEVVAFDDLHYTHVLGLHERS